MSLISPAKLNKLIKPIKLIKLTKLIKLIKLIKFIPYGKRNRFRIYRSSHITYVGSTWC